MFIPNEIHDIFGYDWGAHAMPVRTANWTDSSRANSDLGAEHNSAEHYDKILHTS
jgi:hypothetical protein